MSIDGGLVESFFDLCSLHFHISTVVSPSIRYGKFELLSLRHRTERILTTLVGTHVAEFGCVMIGVRFKVERMARNSEAVLLDTLLWRAAYSHSRRVLL